MLRKTRGIWMAFALAFGFMSSLWLTAGTAHASSCYQGYCIYWNKAESGWGSIGTATSVRLPSSLATFASDDGVEAAAWLIKWDGVLGIETGAVYGYSNGCNTFEPFIHPIATKDNGNIERDNCSYHASLATTYILKSFHNASTKAGFSFFDSQYDTPIWTINWGTYDTGNAENLTDTEIHADNDSPQWSNNYAFTGAQYQDGNGNWNYWGVLNVHNDGPYYGAKVSNTAWNAYS